MYIVILILVSIVIGYFLFIQLKLRKTKSNIVVEWENKVMSSKLNKELFSKANESEKADLLYYYIQKIELQGNYKKKNYLKLPIPLQIFGLIDSLEKEVNNGGFIQFFTNSTGEYVDETIESLSLIGAFHTKTLLEEASKTVIQHGKTHQYLKRQIENIPRNEIFNFKKLLVDDQLMDKLSVFDTEFYKYTDPLSDLALNYFIDNQDEVWKTIKK